MWTNCEYKRSAGLMQTFSSGHDRVVLFMTTQQLWFPAQDQAGSHSNMGGRVLTTPYP